MKIYVTQGHEKGIGLEVFFNSCLSLESHLISKIILIGYKTSVATTLRNLKISFSIDKDFLHLPGFSLKCIWMKSSAVSESFNSLITALEELHREPGILFTLPTSKDQFPDNINGHTEFFRCHYQKSNIGMYFSSPRKKVLLLTDHIRLSDVTKVLNERLIIERTTEAILCLRKWGISFENIYFSGINPHAGEKGLLGLEDVHIEKAIKFLNKKFKISIHGPFAGDSLFNISDSSRDLLVYAFHDQGLSGFKATQGFIGSNISLGLPFPRFSPDHGTSFQQFGKNLADYRGCSYSLKEALNLLNRLGNG